MVLELTKPEVVNSQQKQKRLIDLRFQGQVDHLKASQRIIESY